jgi:plastocyanin
MARRPAVALIAAILLVLAGCGSGSSPAPKPKRTTVAAEHFRFRPQVVTIAPGTAVTFSNRDGTLHSVRVETGRSAAIEPGASWSKRFSRPGAYRFFCPLHPRSMTGVVRVD